MARTLAFAAKQAASRGGQQEAPSALQARWEHEIQVAILRRRAAMARAVQPSIRPDLEWLLAGRSMAAPDIHGRLPCLDEQGEEAEEEADAEA